MGIRTTNEMVHEATRLTATFNAMSSYAVDMLVKERSLLMTKWVSRRVVISGHTMEIYDGNKLKLTCNTTNCSIRSPVATDDSQYFPIHIISQGRPIATLNAKTSSAREDFIKHLKSSMGSADWEVEGKDAWTAFLSVADAINEKKLGEGYRRLPSCQLSVGDVQQHLNELKKVYDLVGRSFHIETLYLCFMEWEKNYTEGADNFAHIVHRLHPGVYAKGRKEGQSLLTLFSRCPRPECRTPLSTSNMYSMHIRGQSIPCEGCKGDILYETYAIEQFKIKHPEFKFDGVRIAVPNTPQDGKWSTFTSMLNESFLVQTRGVNKKEVKRMQASLHAAIDDHNDKEVSMWRMDLVRAMFRQLDFINKVCPHYEYWINQDVIEASINRYEKFTSLMGRKERGVLLVPTIDINLVWHAHQMQHAKYLQYCKVVDTVAELDDSVGCTSMAQGYAETFLLWAKTFGEAYSSCPPSYEAWIKEKPKITRLACRKQWARYGTVPSKDNRYFGVGEAYPLDTMPYAISAAEANSVKRESTREPLPVFVSVIGTPVFDGRVLQPYSHQILLLHRAGLPLHEGGDKCDGVRNNVSSTFACDADSGANSLSC